jgi:hypothetical protein
MFCNELYERNKRNKRGISPPKKYKKTTPAALVAKFAAGVGDTGGKFATGVVDTGGAPLLANISANFQKIRNNPNVIFRGLGEDDSCTDLKLKNS